MVQISSFSSLAARLGSVALLATGCGGIVPQDIGTDGASGGSPAGSHDGSGGVGTDGGAAGSGGKQGTGGTPAIGGAAGDTGGADGVSAPQLIAHPDPEALGLGLCDGTTLAEFVAQIHADYPELADITAFYEADQIGDGSFIYPLQNAGGFSVAVKRGSGDCPAGCISEEFFYFGSSFDCQPVLEGSYSAIYNADGNCYDVTGLPSWGLGRSVAAEVLCDFDPTAQDVGGSYALSASGPTQLCPETASSDWQGKVEFSVVQADVSTGQATVEFQNIHPSIDGHPLPATVVAHKVQVDFQVHEEACVDQLTLDFTYDVAEMTGSLDLFEAVSESCDDPNSDYCKGRINLVLTL